jgi:hypothetical protein
VSDLPGALPRLIVAVDKVDEGVSKGRRTSRRADTTSEALEALAAVALFLYTVASHAGEGRGGCLATRGDEGK